MTMDGDVIQHINYILKERKSGMSDEDFKNELFRLFELSFNLGKEWEDRYWIFKLKKERNDEGRQNNGCETD